MNETSTPKHITDFFAQYNKKHKLSDVGYYNHALEAYKNDATCKNSSQYSVEAAEIFLLKHITSSTDFDVYQAPSSWDGKKTVKLIAHVLELTAYLMLAFFVLTLFGNPKPGLSILLIIISASIAGIFTTVRIAKKRQSTESPSTM